MGRMLHKGIGILFAMLPGAGHFYMNRFRTGTIIMVSLGVLAYLFLRSHGGLFLRIFPVFGVLYGWSIYHFLKTYSRVTRVRHTRPSLINSMLNGLLGIAFLAASILGAYMFHAVPHFFSSPLEQSVGKRMIGFLEDKYNRSFTVVTMTRGLYVRQFRAIVSPEDRPDLRFSVRHANAGSIAFADNYLQVLWTAQLKESIQPLLKGVWAGTKVDIQLALHEEFDPNAHDLEDVLSNGTPEIRGIRMALYTPDKEGIESSKEPTGEELSKLLQGLRDLSEEGAALTLLINGKPQDSLTSARAAHTAPAKRADASTV
ncbi:hypothetical protein SY83_12720 [Paenibacillus swuensis]|uniref:Uncharacterized protein n=1 Tax=Paenibacillus swuensis TaxID=1178515 RepID=A0A172TJB5_9BACL|nr:hypothetical protein [Paenibacillus swuensis]ANE46994.1 hypothetical protein SY83_12720 [Paenibacillus swuensis]